MAGSTGATLIRIDEQPPGYFARDGAPEYSLTVVRGGSGRSHVDQGGEKYSTHYAPGTLALAPAGVPFAVENSAPMDASVLLLPTATIDCVFREQLRGRSLQLSGLTKGAFQDPLLGRLEERLWREASGSTAEGALYVDHLIHTLIFTLYRTSGGWMPAAEERARGGLAPWQVRRVTQYIEDRLAGDVSLEDLSRLLDLSTFHLCRAFKQSTGLPPHRWRHRRRIERARELLEDTDLAVTEVAAQVGYDDPSQLAAAFRKALGVSPSQYRRERRS